MTGWQWMVAISLVVGGCIEERSPKTDPAEPANGDVADRWDAAVDARVDRGADAAGPDAAGPDAAGPDAARPDAAPVPDAATPICSAVPVCPPAFAPVDVCPAGFDCVSVAECGVEILCAPATCNCPGGWVETDLCAIDSPECQLLDQCETPMYCLQVVDCLVPPTCPDGELKIAPCAPNDAMCTLHSACGETFGCVSAECCERPNECPPDTFLDPTCTADDAACARIDDCGRPRWCRTQSTCPPHSHPVDACTLDDPLCWVLYDGQACLSDICPLADPCPACAIPVETCPAGESCLRIRRCGDAQLCQFRPIPPPGEGDACADSCEAGWQAVQGCRPGRVCSRHLGCCGQELYCEQCETPDCAQTVEPGGCPPFTSPIERCAPRARGCMVLPNGQACGIDNVCPPGETCVIDDPDRCEDRDFGKDDDGLPDPQCWPGSRYADACSPNGRRCVQSSICGFSAYCEACSPCEAGCLTE